MTKLIMSAAAFALAAVAFGIASPASADPYIAGSVGSASEGSSYGVALGLTDPVNRTQLEFNRGNVSHRGHRNYFGASVTHNFNSINIAGFTPFVAVGAGYVNVTDDHSCYCHSNGGSVHADIGVSHDVTDRISGDLYVRQSHDWVEAPYAENQTSVGVQVRVRL